jgi:esterase/lipase
MNRRTSIILIIISIALILIAGGGFLSMKLSPRAVQDTWESSIQEVLLPETPAGLEKYLEKRESRFGDITPDTEKKITWAYPDKRKTDYSIVYLHGFGATRHEIAPVQNIVADNLKANLFETRLAGHGRGEALGEAKARQWLQDAEEAYRIGRRIGNRVFIIAMSTGVPLGIWLMERYPDDSIAGAAYLSANFSPLDKTSWVMIYPGGLWLAKQVMGEKWTWKPYNERMGIYWTTSHKVEALQEMMLLLDYMNRRDYSKLQQPVLFVYSEEDDVIDPASVKKRFPEFGSEQKKLMEFEPAWRHNLASDILAPKNVKPMSDLITGYFREIMD